MILNRTTILVTLVAALGCGSAETLRGQSAQPTSFAAVDPAQHAQHAQQQAPAATTPAQDPNASLVQQLAEMRARIAQLEAALAQPIPAQSAVSQPATASTPPMSSAAARPMAMPTGAMTTDKQGRMGMGSMGVAPMQASAPAGMSGMTGTSASPGMSAGATPAPPMAGMSGAAAPASGAMNMMGMMEKMMGMMDKMMSMGGGAPMPNGGSMPSSGSGMEMDMMTMSAMGTGGSMPATLPASGVGKMSGGGGMMGMMSMGGSGSMTQSALPGFPGASHLYHIGATDFFLDHAQHIVLTTEQQAALNQAKEQEALGKSTADRAVEQAEQTLWTLTAADQPDAIQIEAKIRDIEKLRGDERLAFIHAVGDASKVLTDEQRKILTGFAPPVSAAPAGAPMASGMKDM